MRFSIREILFIKRVLFGFFQFLLFIICGFGLFYFLELFLLFNNKNSLLSHYFLENLIVALNFINQYTYDLFDFIDLKLKAILSENLYQICSQTFIELKKKQYFIYGFLIFFSFFLLYFGYQLYKKTNKNKFIRNNRFEKIKTLKQMFAELNPASFEDYVSYLFQKQGYKNSKRVGVGADNNKTLSGDHIYGDGGKDVVIERLFLKDIIIQCKFYNPKNLVGVSVIREMYAIQMHYKAKKVIIVTTSKFSKDAINFAKGKPIELINSRKLVELAQEYLG